jgi:hypothetical protein
MPARWESPCNLPSHPRLVYWLDAAAKLCIFATYA